MKCPLRGHCYKDKNRAKQIEVTVKMLKYIKEQQKKLAKNKQLYSRRMIRQYLGINKDFRQFMLRDLEKVKIEFGLIAVVYNIENYMKK